MSIQPIAVNPVTGVLTYSGSLTGSNITDGSIGVADLSATGTPSSSTYLRGDNTWATVSGSGAILATTQYVLATAATTSSSTFADVDATNLRVTFTAPASGNVLVRLEAMQTGAGSSTTYGWNLRDGGGDVANTKREVCFNLVGIWLRATVGIYVTGLTPGTSYTWKWGHGLVAGAGTCTFAGNNTTAESALMVVTAA